jgi:hypothetical protein
MMAPISGLWATIQGWPWSIIISAAALSVVAYTQIIRPWRRRRRLRRPFDAYFVITTPGRFRMGYVVQDDKEHYVKELVVPSHSEVSIQIALEPKLSFLQHELYFGCDEGLVDEEKPRATEWFVPFVREGVRRSGKPDEAHPGHYTDYNGFYHVRENYLYTKDARVIGFKLVTRRTGTFPAQIYFVTDDVRGKAELSIRVEQPARTKMRCKKHRRCFVVPSAGHSSL